jgi:poly-gamma-glutamate synthesis protein (capsule biosynthesis protein)
MKRLIFIFITVLIPFLLFSFLATSERKDSGTIIVFYDDELVRERSPVLKFSDILMRKGYDVREGTFKRESIDYFLISNPLALYVTQKRLNTGSFTLHEQDCYFVWVPVTTHTNPLNEISRFDFIDMLKRDSTGSKTVAERVERGRMALGVISFYDLRLGLKPLAIDGVFPSLNVIKNGTYPGASRFYVYTVGKNPVFDEEYIAQECGLWIKKAFSVIAGGDIMLSRGAGKYIEMYGSSYPFLYIADEIKKHDIALANLESPITERGMRFQPNKGIYFRADTSVVEGLKFSGFNVFSLANNHSFDWGIEGIMDTIELLERNGLKYSGVGRNRREALMPAIIPVGGTKVAFISFNDIYPDRIEEDNGRTLVTLTLDSPELENEVRMIKKNCDVLIASVHTGIEYVLEPEPEKIEKMRRLINYGVDIVLGSHPHVVQEIELYRNGLIAYSLGNLIFDQNWSEDTSMGLLLEIGFIGKKPVYFRTHIISIMAAQARLRSDKSVKTVYH